MLFLWCWPLALLMLGGLQLFPQPGWVDPAIYLGHFMNLPELLDRFGATYFALRWMWVLAGAGAYAVLQPEVAHYAVVFGTIQIAVWSLYALLRPIAGRWAALAGAASLATMPAFLAAATGGYVDGLATALVLATGAALRRLPAPAGPVAAGVVAMAAANTHPFAVIVAGFWFLVHAIGLFPRWRPLLRDAGLAIAGAGLCLLAFCTISWGLGGRFLFFLAIAETAATQIAMGGKFASSFETWLPNAATLHVAAAALLAALALTGRDRGLLLGAAFLAVTTTIFAGFDIAVGGATLQFPFYTSYLTGPVALLTGCLLARADGLGPILPVTVCIAGAAPIFGAPCLSRPDAALTEIPVITGFYAVAGATALLFLLSRWMAPRLLTLVAGAAMLLGAGGFAVTNAQARALFVEPVGIDFRDFHVAAVRFLRSVQAANLADRRLLFWYDRADFGTDLPERDARIAYRLRFAGNVHDLTFYDSLSGLYLWDRVLLQDTIGPLNPRAVAEVAYGTTPLTIIVLGQRRDVEALAARRLAEAGVATTLRAKFDINAGQVQFFAWLLDVTPMTAR